MKKWFKENDLAKVVLLSILVTLVLTWIVPNGSIVGSKFTKLVDSANKAAQAKLGLFELTSSVIYAINFFLQQIAFVIIVGVFYGIISRADGYKALVTACAKKIKGKEIPAVLCISAVIAAFTSLTSQILVVLLIIPFAITVLLNAKLDKLTAFATTFGALFIGLIGATYGTEGLYYFNYYMTQYAQAKVTAFDDVSVRFIILLVGYILFSIFNIKHVQKVVASKKVDDTKEDLFAVEKVESKKTKIWPIVTVLVVTLLFVILGYINWEADFKIKFFNDLHAYFVGTKEIKSDILKNIVEVLRAIVGGSQGEMFAQAIPGINAFGAFDIFGILPVLLVAAIVTVLSYKVKITDAIDGAFEGAKKMVKPAVFMVLAYSIFVLVYWSPIVPRLVTYVMKADFSIIGSAAGAAISSIFTADFGYVGYQLGTFINSSYAADLDKIYVIFPAMYGFVQMLAPTSVLLLVGLAYSNISYKEWMKYIWKFALTMLVVLIFIFAVIA